MASWKMTVPKKPVAAGGAKRAKTEANTSPAAEPEGRRSDKAGKKLQVQTMEELAEAQELLLKMSLKSAQTNRDLTAITMVTVLMDSSHNIVEQMKEAGKMYATTTKAAPQAHGLGAAHPHIFMAALESLLEEDLEGLKVEEGDAKEALEVLLTMLEDKVRAQRSLKYFKGKDTYRAPGSKAPPQYKIQMHLDLQIPREGLGSLGAQTLMLESLIHVGAIEKYGSAPPDAMDRQAQTRLTGMRK